MTERKETRPNGIVFTVGLSGEVIKAEPLGDNKNPIQAAWELQQKIIKNGQKPETPKLEG